MDDFILLTWASERPNWQSAGRQSLPRSQQRLAFTNMGVVNETSQATNDSFALSLDFCDSTHAQPVETLCAMPKRSRQRLATSVSPFSFVPRCMYVSASSDCVIFSSGKSGTRGAPAQETGRVSGLERCRGADESRQRGRCFHGYQFASRHRRRGDERIYQMAIDRFCDMIWWLKWTHRVPCSSYARLWELRPTQTQVHHNH